MAACCDDQTVDGKLQASRTKMTKISDMVTYFELGFPQISFALPSSDLLQPPSLLPHSNRKETDKPLLHSQAPAIIASNFNCLFVLFFFFFLVHIFSFSGVLFFFSLLQVNLQSDKFLYIIAFTNNNICFFSSPLNILLFHFFVLSKTRSKFLCASEGTYKDKYHLNLYDISKRE